MQSTAQVLKRLITESRYVFEAKALIELAVKHLSALPSVTGVAACVRQANPPHHARARAGRGLSTQSLEALLATTPTGEGDANLAWPTANLPPGMRFCAVLLPATQEQVTVTCDGVDAEALSQVTAFLALVLERQPQAAAQQSQKLQAVGALASGIAHDFNNVLAAILAHLELAGLEPALTDNADLVAATRAAVRGRDVVRQLLAFGRSRPDEKSPLRMQRIIEDSMCMLRATMPTAVGLRLSSDHKAPAVWADATQLQQVLVNLVTLAAHALPGEGTVELSLATRPGNPPGVELTVTSQGQGLPPVREERSLGLSVVRTLIKSHGGTLELTPASAVVTLPGVAPAESPARAPPDAAPGKQQRVALVDDQPLVARATERLVSQLGYDVTIFTGADAVLRDFAARADAYALVLTDQSMPDMTGLELAQALRAKGLQVPVLLVTGLPTEIDATTVTQPFLVLGKPYRSEELASGLAQLLGT